MTKQDKKASNTSSPLNEGEVPVSTVKKMFRHVGNVFTSFGLIIILLVVWQTATTLTSNPYFPRPSDVLVNTYNLMVDPNGAGPNNLFPFLYRMVSGFIIGAGVGILIGITIGLRRQLNDVFTPIIEFLRSIPATATLPIFIILLGGDENMRIAFIAFGLTWYVIINTAAGVSTIDPVLIDMARAFRLPKLKMLFQVVLPAALPKTFAGLRIALTTAMLLTVVSEFFLVSRGIGFQLLQAQNQFAFLNLWSWMVVLAVLGYLVNTLLEFIERRVLKWDRESYAS
jgi:ABC-type nitrate/sulfonate/bicarbonate transport system permease component